MTPQPTLYLLDASSYIHRAFHAVKALSTSQGIPTNAVFGFTQMLLKLLKDAAPSYLAVVYDSAGPTFRHREYPAYKANRPPVDPALKSQFDLVRQIVDGFGLKALECPGFEADDIMATLTRQALQAGFAVVLVSGDKDLFQLIGQDVSMWDTMKDLRLDAAEVLQKLGIKPEQMVDYLALTGDSSDNLPGVPGIGPKTAAKLLDQYHDLDNLLSHSGELKGKVKESLGSHSDLALMTRELARLSHEAPVSFEPDEYKVLAPDPARLNPILAKLEFTRLLKEFTMPLKSPETNYAAITNLAELRPWLERIKKSNLVSLDTETTSLNAMEAELVGIALALEPGQAAYMPLEHTALGPDQQIPLKEALQAIKPLVLDPEVKKIGQNIKYDYMVLARHGLEMQGLYCDAMIADYLLDPGRHSHSLESIASQHLHRGMISYDQATGGKNKLFSGVDLPMAVNYAAEDADVALQAADFLLPRLDKADLSQLFHTLEMPLVPVLARMEMAGVLLDLKDLALFSQELETDLKNFEQECYRLAGHEFNLNSSQQLGVVLFEELGLAPRKKTKKKTGYSTDVQVLTELALLHPLPKAILDYRSLAKLKSTYVDALPALVNSHTGRVHTSFNQAVTATGRLSSSDPNLQNIPVRNELGARIRRAFIPAPGKTMISADYSQIELKVLAHLSQDPLLLEDMAQGLDVHTQTASRLFDVPPGLVSSEMRRRAKTVNFGVIYGMSSFRLAREQNISLSEAQDIISRYLGRYAGIARFQQENLSHAREHGYVTTILGRRRFLPAINSADRVSREAAERMALNTPIQGSAADIIKLAMLKADELLNKEFPQTIMILQVHDELVFECPQNDVPGFSSRLKEIMENVITLSVQLTVDIGSGANWAQAH